MEQVVIIFAYHFPPENSIGGNRPYLFRKYLSEMGYHCHVITAANQGCHPSSDIEYVPDPFVTRPRTGVGWQLERAIRKLVFPGAMGFQWSRLACRSARKFLLSKENSEVTVYSTFPPFGTHLAAFLLTRNRKLKWIADFRDPMYLHPGHHSEFSRFKRAAYQACERAILRGANAILVTADTLAEQWKCRYPGQAKRIQVIWNGFDPDDRIEETAPPQSACRLFSHVGALYGGRDIAPLLESVSRLVNSGRLRPGTLRIRLVGPVDKDCLPSTEFLARATNQGWLEIIPEQVSRPDARRMAYESNGLLLVQPHSTVQVPGKLFEYVRLRRPILAFIRHGTPIERILRQSAVTHQCVYAEDSPQEIDNAVERFLTLEDEGNGPNAWFEDNFNARSQTEALAALIRSLHHPAGRNAMTTERSEVPINAIPRI
jgi:hypothetical protein